MAIRWHAGTGRTRNLLVLSVLLGVPVTQPLAQTQTAGGFEQLGIRTETWNIFPSLGLSAVYDDNVFAVPDDSDFLESDISFVLTPQVTAVANTQRHAFSVFAGGSIGRFVEQTDQNFNNYNVGGSARWDLSRTLNVSSSFGFSQTREDQADPDRDLFDQVATETTNINSFSFDLSASKNWQRLFMNIGTGVQRTTFDELDATIFEIVGPFAVRTDESFDINADRDRTRIPLNLRVGYDVDRDYSVFFNISYSNIIFDEPEQFVDTATAIVLPEGVPQQVITGQSEGDSQDFQTLGLGVGANVDFDQLVSGSVSVGVQQRFPEDDDDEDNISLSFDLGLDWTLSPRTSLNLGGSQGFEPATADDAGGSTLNTRLNADLSYALTRQTSLGANVAYGRRSGGDDDRTDDDITTGVSASYAINRYASVSASYQYRQRFSTDTDREFTRNLVFVSLVGQY